MNTYAWGWGVFTDISWQLGRPPKTQASSVGVRSPTRAERRKQAIQPHHCSKQTRSTHGRTRLLLLLESSVPPHRLVSQFTRTAGRGNLVSDDAIWSTSPPGVWCPASSIVYACSSRPSGRAGFTSSLLHGCCPALPSVYWIHISSSAQQVLD
jgi:hypothetical protein